MPALPVVDTDACHVPDADVVEWPPGFGCSLGDVRADVCHNARQRSILDENRVGDTSGES